MLKFSSFASEYFKKHKKVETFDGSLIITMQVVAK